MDQYSSNEQGELVVTHYGEPASVTNYRRVELEAGLANHRAELESARASAALIPDLERSVADHELLVAKCIELGL